MSFMDDYVVADAAELPTPALLVYRDYVAENIRRIGELLGGFDRLRPHVKTHKMSQVARMEMDAGISKFKCATPKEAAMLAAIGVTDILVSYPLVGAAIDRVLEIRSNRPNVSLSVIGDDEGALKQLSDACEEAGVGIGVYLDLNTGMDRTGAHPGADSVSLAKKIEELPGLHFCGLHVYDGHVAEPNEDARRQSAVESIGRAVETRTMIEESGLRVEKLVASGSPGFEFTSDVSGVDEVSPGTWIFWDVGYNEKMPDRFRWAALVLSRVISTPEKDLITLDAGSKSISPDTLAPHFKVLGMPGEVEFVRRNEEHQVLRLPEGTPLPRVGDAFYLVPYHVCTTVNLWDEAHIIEGDGSLSETWAVDARGH